MVAAAVQGATSLPTSPRRAQKCLSLTECQGRCLFHLPFPTQAPKSVDDICAESGIGADYLPEVLDLVETLISHGVTERESE